MNLKVSKLGQMGTDQSCSENDVFQVSLSLLPADGGLALQG